MLEIIIVFACGFLLDFVFAWYILSVVNNRPFMSALSSVCTAIPGLIGTVSVVYDWHMAIPYVLGLFAGTYSYVYASSNQRIDFGPDDDFDIYED